MPSRLSFHNPAHYHPVVLFGFSFLCFILGVLAYGSAVPSGLFVPCLLIGGSFGRAVGELVLKWGVDANPAMYALIGASAVLSGVTRITITISVILYETTDKVYLILPIMASVLIAKWIADCFNISLYDSYIELQHAPFIESHPPERFADETAGDIMVQPAIVLRERESLSRLLDVFALEYAQRFPRCVV